MTQKRGSSSKRVVNDPQQTRRHRLLPQKRLSFDMLLLHTGLEALAQYGSSSEDDSDEEDIRMMDSSVPR